MKKNIVVSLAILAVGLLFLSSIVFAQGVNSIVNANNQFAFELYSKYKSKEGNIFFSPYSISSAIAMTYEGARGKTADEIQSVFHFPKDEYLRRESFLKINNRINKEDKRYALHTANALWAQKDYPFLEGYFNLIKNYYGGEATNVDFVNHAEESRLTINSWVEEQTDHRIKDLISQGAIDPLSRLILTNAVYFKGSWLKQFDKDDTKYEDFRVGPGNTVKTFMMHYSSSGEKEFNYAETGDLQILELPYKGEDLSMLILLPKEDDLKTLEESLSAEKLSEWRRLFRKEEVIVYFPRFKFENEYFMKDALREMGMPTAFTFGIDFGGEADFSGMTGNKDLNIDEIIHKAFVEVNEEGTEAAAATYSMEKGGAIKGAVSRKKVFKADHPFIFLIKEKETGNILFMGRVSNPQL